MLEYWMGEDKARAKEAQVGHAYSAAISACDKGGRFDEALALLERMEARGVPQPLEAYNAAISACRHVSDDADDAGLETAHALLKRLRVQGLRPRLVFGSIAP